MAVVFTHGGTVLTFTSDPPKEGYANRRFWLNPFIESAGGKTFCYNKGQVMDVKTLTWRHMNATDMAALVSFLDDVGGAAHSFTYTDPGGTSKTAFIWNAEELRSYPTYPLYEEITIELLIPDL